MVVVWSRSGLSQQSVNCLLLETLNFKKILDTSGVALYYSCLMTGMQQIPPFKIIFLVGMGS